MKRIGIIGGGASGLITAIFASSLDTEVTILERNPFCGKKVLATGNGRCNYWNERQGIDYYHSSDIEILKRIITPDLEKEVLDFFASIGIVPKIKNGYYYPFSNQAKSIRNALVTEAKRRGVIILNTFLVESVTFSNDVFVVHSKNETKVFDKLVLATGSKASSKTGSDGSGYVFAKSFSHTIIPVIPALVQLVSDRPFLKKWSGVRCDAIVSIYVNQEKMKEEIGELQLTDYGISGICVFNLSYLASQALVKHQDVFLKINFLPFLKEDVATWFYHQNKLVKNRSVAELLECILNEKLVSVLLQESFVNPSKGFDELKEKEKERLYQNLTEFVLPIVKTKDYLDAQVCSGGVSLKEVCEKTMESKKQKGLYLVGEILDVNGDCGGYNLGFAWMSGILAGKNIRSEK